MSSKLGKTIDFEASSKCFTNETRKGKKMSYEGYSQFLCKKGHYWTLDCYYIDYNDDDDDDNLNCPECGNKSVWENMVDVTNGSYDTNPETGKEERIDGYAELKEKNRKECDKCHTPLVITFKIPRKGRIK